MKCPSCDGKGTQFVFLNKGPDWRDHESGEIECDRCQGGGTVPDEMAKWMIRGADMRARRMEAGIPLHEAAIRKGISVAELSAMENGKRRPNAGIERREHGADENRQTVGASAPMTGSASADGGK